MSTTSSKKPAQDSDPPRDALASLRIERGTTTRRRKSKKKWIILVILLAIGGGGYWAYTEANKEDSVLAGAAWVPESLQSRLQVRLKSVSVQEGRSADAVVVATGYLEAHRQAKIGARAPGRIEIIDFEEGRRVKKGEVLAVLEHRDMDAALAASEASVARAKAGLSEQEIAILQAERDDLRAEKLWEQRSIAESELDQFEFALRAAKARKESMEADLQLAIAQRDQAAQSKENMIIRAPFDGTVISKDAEVGESILPGGMGGGSGRGSVATIADLDDLEIVCDVQEDFIARVKEGQEAEIAVDAVPDKKYHGMVRKIIPMGDRARATIKVEVAITDADGLLFPEMSGTVFFLPTEDELAAASDEPRIFGPTSAVTSDAEGNHYVWVVDSERRAQRIQVSIGDDRDGRTEILDGLSGRERVVVNPAELVVGAPVTVTE